LSQSKPVKMDKEHVKRLMIVQQMTDGLQPCAALKLVSLQQCRHTVLLK